jgi:hypothetical protein
MELESTNGSLGRQHQLQALLVLCAFIAIGLITLQLGSAAASIMHSSVVVSNLLVSTRVVVFPDDVCAQAAEANNALVTRGQKPDTQMCSVITDCLEQSMLSLVRYSSSDVATYELMQGSVPTLEQASWPVHNGRIMHCSVTNGLADMLVQTFRCWVRARAQNRLLVLRTSAGLFAEPLGKYISILGNVTDVHPAMYREWQNKTVWPRGSQGCIAAHVKSALTLAPPSRHTEDIVMYDGGKGGQLKSTFYKYMRFTPLAIAEGKRRLSLLPRAYVGVHVRNTDLHPKADIPMLIQTWAPALKRPFFLATDNATTLAEFQQAFGDLVHSFSFLPANAKGAIHKMEGVPPHVRNLDAVADLICLAHAKSLLLSNPRSGYARLAAHLQDNTEVLQMMMQRTY